MRATQEDVEVEEEEEDAAEGAAADDGDEDEEEELSPLVRILSDRSSHTEGNIYRLVFVKETR